MFANSRVSCLCQWISTSKLEGLRSVGGPGKGVTLALRA